MKAFFAVLIALGFSAVSAVAADRPSNKAPLVVPPPVFTWTGFYLGFNFGHAWTASDSIDTASANLLDATVVGWGPASALGATGGVGARLNGFVSGGQAGYNWQFADRLVAGFEADLQGAGVRGGGGFGNVTPSPLVPRSFAVTSATVKRSLEYFGTVRGRLGFAVTPTMLVYATGGLAHGGVNTSATIGRVSRPPFCWRTPPRAMYSPIASDGPWAGVSNGPSRAI